MKLVLTVFIITTLSICVNVCWSVGKAPTSPKILFTSSRDGNWEIYIMNPDGSDQVNLSQHPSSDLTARWSPTGEQILFVSNRQGTRVRDLYIMDADGSNVRRVFKRKIKEWRGSPSWSPNGKNFVYITSDRDRPRVSLHLGTFGEEDSEILPWGNSPDWSPDGSEIVCSVGHPNGTRLTFMNIRTRKREQPIKDKILLWQSQPSWSSTGDRIAFSGNKHPLPEILDRDLHDAWMDKRSIYLVNRDGSGLRLLVDEAGPETAYPKISPDGSKVLYTQEINGRLQIFKLDINSLITTQLTHGGIFFQANSGGDWFDPAYTSLPVNPQTDMLTTIWGQLKVD